DACAVLDEQPEHIDAVALGGPDEALVDHLLRFVRRLPHREAAVRAVEGAVRTCLRRPDELSDHLRQTEPGGDAEVPRLEPGQDRALSMAPEERRDEWRAAVAAGGEVEPAAGVEHELGELWVVLIAGLVQLRPSVVVAAVRVGAAVEQLPDVREAA